MSSPNGLRKASNFNKTQIRGLLSQFSLFSLLKEGKGKAEFLHISLCFRCSGKYISCPYGCPSSESSDPKAKGFLIDCDKPICKAVCRRRKLNCNAPGSGCYDPRFIGGDGRVFYFHGKSNENFALVSDSDLRINAHFIGHRPTGRSHHYTWIQALGILFHSQSFSLEATRSVQWNDDVDLLKFTYNGNDRVLPEGALSSWKSPEGEIKAERIARKNSVVNVVPVIGSITTNCLMKIALRIWRFSLGW
ncbi:Root cap [Senna tora]|uniref:Root cap n=1 Tax=Senna tora TaxID=362788 RepID=A0A834WHV7_9FABA|nr:Root cap [Senna tora]